MNKDLYDEIGVVQLIRERIESKLTEKGLDDSQLYLLGQLSDYFFSLEENQNISDIQDYKIQLTPKQTRYTIGCVNTDDFEKHMASLRKVEMIELAIKDDYYEVNISKYIATVNHLEAEAESGIQEALNRMKKILQAENETTQNAGSKDKIIH